MIKEISSLQNDLVKEIVQLQEKSRTRKKLGLFVIEGQREIKLAIEGAYKLKQILFCEDIISKNEIDQLIIATDQKEPPVLIRISIQVYQKIAHRKTTEGVVAVAESKELSLRGLELKNDCLVLIAEASEKPGNIGALLRTADAANLDAVIIANPKTDFYNPNIIRSSVGCVFTNQIAQGSTDEILDLLKEKKINIYAAALDKRSLPYHQMDYTKASAIVVGTEATGLSEQWMVNAKKNIIIPMQGKIDSLNVSVSAAIVIFEAKRQRNFGLSK
ncbi:RNA methyltransferase [Lutimonas halocynthiae]|uniref:TrmH family RNA methyltransferase n=1 Tax=Lutimonas halocynthiae TaxID=1446477 RepID=UPI0025B418E7|nr:RNA methyltransferase [Lutimonas halocynthiae]MDN3644333.1 RNA methyltransferase [Lutimonas halocynthiae]